MSTGTTQARRLARWPRPSKLRGQRGEVSCGGEDRDQMRPGVGSRSATGHMTYATMSRSSTCKPPWSGADQADSGSRRRVAPRGQSVDNSLRSRASRSAT
jgi:hypothetical protein